MDPRLAARRRKVAETRVRRGIRRLLFVLLVVGLAAVTLAVLRSELFSLDRIDVQGESQTDPVALVAAAGVEPGMPLIEIDLDEAKEALEADPRVVSAEVGRKMADRCRDRGGRALRRWRGSIGDRAGSTLPWTVSSSCRPGTLARLRHASVRLRRRTVRWKPLCSSSTPWSILCVRVWSSTPALGC
jgi:hypothetical protein